MSTILENNSLPAWILANEIKTEDGTPYTFDNHMFMFEPLQELARLDKDVCIYKAAQIGFSTAAMLATFWVAKNKGIDLIYTLPTQGDVKDFAGGKINRIVAQNPILQDWVKDRDTVEQKTIGDSIIYYRGTFVQKAAMMVSSDLNVHDEIDASDQKVIEQYSTRLQASNLRRQWIFSHPSVPGKGVSKHWKDSDQRHWFITCPHCEKEQYMDFPDSFNLETQEYICKHCKGVLDNKTRRNGRWVKKFKDKEVVGFWIPLWICPWIEAKDIIKYHNTKSEEYFINKVAGLPYVGRDNKPTYDMITKNLTDKVNPQDGWIVIGSDTGIKYSYVVGNHRGLFYYNNNGTPDDIRDLLKRWKKSVVVFDAGGDLTEPRKIREEYPGRVFLCNYRRDRKTMQFVSWGKGEEEGNVVADRNRMIQLVLNEFQDGLIPLQGSESDWYDFWLSWDDIYRVDEENKLGVVERKWERSNNNDHLMHASVYWRIGMDRFAGSSGGKIFEKPSTYQQGMTIAPDMTIPAPDPSRVFKLSNNGD